MKTNAFIKSGLVFFGHLSLATYGVALLVFGLAYAFAAAFDQQGYLIDYFFVSPTFAVPVAVGLLFGYGFGWRLPRPVSSFIPVPSSALLGYGLYNNHQEGLPWTRIVATFFGVSCGADDCYRRFGAQAMIVAPLIAALAYVIGAGVRKRERVASGISTAPGQHRWRKRACVGFVVVAIFGLSALQRVAHKGNEVEFYWSAATGFQRASLTYPPEPRYPPVSRWVKIVIAPIDLLIVLQTKPRIASEMRAMAWKSATGCVGPVTPPLLPVVFGLNHLSTASCALVDLTAR